MPLKSFVAAGDEARATPAEERRVLQETGMPLVESLALGMAMAVYSVLPKSELGKISYGADPMAWSGFKQQVKFGNGTFLDFKGAKADPAELRRRPEARREDAARQGVAVGFGYAHELRGRPVGDNLR